MRILVLTTETVHHAFYVRALRSVYPATTVFCERGSSVRTSFQTHHAFEIEREIYEKSRWFDCKETSLKNLAQVRNFSSLNDREAISAIEREKPDVVVVFGTGVLKQPLIDVCPKHLFNLHGGDPEEYRGLDNHLWAIYHKDYSGLVTTLHLLEPALDAGGIVLQGMVPLYHGMPLHALRAANTEICVRLTLTVIDMILRDGKVLGRPQMRRGRYYSAMPAVLKAVCQERFETYVQTLPK
jgi:methionyl-tRNA formyltransferase